MRNDVWTRGVVGEDSIIVCVVVYLGRHRLLMRSCFLVPFLGAIFVAPHQSANFRKLVRKSTNTANLRTKNATVD